MASGPITSPPPTLCLEFPRETSLILRCTGNVGPGCKKNLGASRAVGATLPLMPSASGVTVGGPISTRRTWLLAHPLTVEELLWSIELGLFKRSQLGPGSLRF